MEGVWHVAECVAVKAQVWRAEGTCALGACLVARCPRAPTHAPPPHPRPWGQAEVSLTSSTVGPPCPRGIRRFFAIVHSLVCESTESFSDFLQKTVECPKSLGSCMPLSLRA